MSVIRQLPPSVINKIAAGEVIERPASVVKELMENALDAGATRIEVAAEQGGGQLIRVADNGSGMTAEDLPLAVASHATSKIYDADDLFRVATLGFRGEALASIAEVSSFRLISRIAQNEAGAELEVVGGRLGPVQPSARSVGTTIEVRNLFYNTPVRRKFMKTPQTEMGRISEAFARIALSAPAVHLVLRHNDRVVHDLPPVDTWRERILALFGRELQDALLSVSSESESLRIGGFVAEPQISRTHNRMQYLYLNGRHIRDRSLQHALSEAYRGLLMSGRYPVCFLRMDMPPASIDVNVHPTKLEVRFEDAGAVYSRLLATLRQRFLTTDMTARVDARTEPPASTAGQASSAVRQEWSHWAQGEATSTHAPIPRFLPFGSSPQHRAPPPAVTAPWEASPESSQTAPRDAPPWPTASTQAGPSALSRDSTSPLGLQIHQRYLVAESDDGLLIIDQHALHERVLYEKFRQRLEQGPLESQRLLAPRVVDLSPQEAAAALEHRDLLADLGLVVEPFGGDSVAVLAYPALLNKSDPAEWLRLAVEQLLAGGQPQRRSMLENLLSMMACKAAVKAGDSLTPQEVSALLEHRQLCQDSHHCPHGRPTALFFSQADLDRRFKRT